MYYTLTEDESLQKLSQQAEEKINKRNNCYSHNNHSSSNDTGVDGGGGCDDDSYTNIINSNSDSCRSESDSNSTSNGNSNSNSNSSSSSSSNNNNKEYKIVVETAVETEYKKVVNADAIDLFPEKEIGPRSSPSSSSSSASSLSSEATSSMNPSSFEGGGGVPYVGSGGEEYTSRTTTATMADPSLCAPSPPPITSRRRSNSRSLSRISVEDGTILCSPPVSLDNTENANGDDDDHHHHHHHHHHRHHEEGSVSAESNTCSTPSEGGVRYSVVIHTQELGLNIDPNTGIIQDVTNEELLSAPIVSASEIIIHGDKVVQIGNTQLFDGNTVVYVPDIIADNTQRPITIVIERDPTLYCFVDGPFYNRGIDNDDIDHRFNRSDVGMDNNDDTIILPTAE